MLILRPTLCKYCITDYAKFNLIACIVFAFKNVLLRCCLLHTLTVAFCLHTYDERACLQPFSSADDKTVCSIRLCKMLGWPTSTLELSPYHHQDKNTPLAAQAKATKSKKSAWDRPCVAPSLFWPSSHCGQHTITANWNVPAALV